MDLAQINQEIAREKACVDDLTKLISMHTQEKRYKKAEQLGQDLLKSLAYIQQLEQQLEERKRFYITKMRKVKYANQS